MSEFELNKRCNEVFFMEQNEYVYDVEKKEDGQLRFFMSEIVNDDVLCFVYEPDMSERPEAAEYLAQIMYIPIVFCLIVFYFGMVVLQQTHHSYHMLVLRMQLLSFYHL